MPFQLPSVKPDPEKPNPKLGVGQVAFSNDNRFLATKNGKKLLTLIHYPPINSRAVMKWSFSFLPAVVLFLFQTTCPMLFGCGIYLNYVSLQFYYSQTQSEVCITLRIYFS